MTVRRRAADVDEAVAGFTLGQRCTLLGTPVEVLGWARWRTTGGYVYHEVTLRTEEAERWTLELDQGHALLFRAAPDLDLGAPGGTPGQQIELDRKRWAWLRARARLEKVEGEYWKDLVVGDIEEGQSFYAAPTALHAGREVGAGEDWEWSQGLYLDRRDVERAFELTLPPIAEPHPARPWPYRPWTLVLATVLPILGVLSLLAALALRSEGDGQLLREEIPLGELTGETAVGVFDVDETTLVGVRLAAEGLHQSWVWAEVGLGPVPAEAADPETLEPEMLARLPTELSYYEGRDSEGHWVESATAQTEGIRVGGGTYMVWLGWELDPQAAARLAGRPVTLTVQVSAGYRAVTPLVVWGVLCLLAGLGIWLAKRSVWHRVLVEHDLREEAD